jgi:hypothetical protein
MPYWEFPDEDPSISGTGSITTIDDRDENWKPKRKQFPFGFQAPKEPDQARSKPRRRRRRRRS